MELMEYAPLNAALSEEVYRSQNKRCKPRMCYANVYRAVTDHHHKIRSGEWKIAYGYYTLNRLSDRALARHAFLLDEENRVIDPTIFSQRKPDLTHGYYVMYVFSGLEEYLQAVDLEGYFPALEKYLRDVNKQAYQWAIKNGYLLCG